MKNGTVTLSVETVNEIVNYLAKQQWLHVQDLMQKVTSEIKGPLNKEQTDEDRPGETGN